MTTFEPDGEGGWTAHPVEVARVNLGDLESPWGENAVIDSEGELCVSLDDCTDRMDDRSAWFFANGRLLYQRLIGGQLVEGWEDLLLAQIARSVVRDSGHCAFAQVAQMVKSHQVVTMVGGEPTDWLPGMPNLKVYPRSRHQPDPSRTQISAVVATDSAPSSVVPLKPETTPREVVMRDVDRGDLHSRLSATLNEDGDLVISGQDLGQQVERTLGQDEYEYVLTYAQTDLPMVLQALCEDPDVEVLEAIEKNWCGPEKSVEFERILREAEVPARTWNWW